MYHMLLYFQFLFIELVSVSRTFATSETAHVEVLRIVRDVASADSQHQPLRYNVFEERPAQTLVISDIAGDAGLRVKYTSSELSNIKLTMLNTSASTKYFLLDSQQGRLLTAGPIDRDSVCSRMDSCLLYIDIA